MRRTNIFMIDSIFQSARNFLTNRYPIIFERQCKSEYFYEYIFHAKILGNEHIVIEWPIDKSQAFSSSVVCLCTFEDRSLIVPTLTILAILQKCNCKESQIGILKERIISLG